MNTLPRAALALLLLPSLACEIAQPFGGPGFDPGEGVTLETESDTVVVALTNAVVDPDGRAAFDQHVDAVVQSLEAQPGFIGHSLRAALFGKEVWTMTVWTDEAAMLAFVSGEAHQTAIAESSSSLEFARFHHLEVSKDEIPLSWDRALELLDEQADPYATN